MVSGTSQLRARVFDDEENFLVDVRFTCNCLSVTPVTSISRIYANALRAPNGTYTEVEGASVTTTVNTCNAAQVQAHADPRCPPLTVDANGNPLTSGTFISSSTTTTGPTPFTGFRAITAIGLDGFGRLSNANVNSLQGTLTTVIPGVTQSR